MEIELHHRMRERGKLKDMCLQKEIAGSVRATLRRRFSEETLGAELVEFAMMVLVLVILIIGIFWVGRAISVYQALGRAAREGARIALAPSCATCGDAAATYATVQTAVQNYLNSASINGAAATVTVTPGTTLDPPIQRIIGITKSPSRWVTRCSSTCLLCRAVPRR